jgi:hypothetical protein
MERVVRLTLQQTLLSMRTVGSKKIDVGKHDEDESQNFVAQTD